MREVRLRRAALVAEEVKRVTTLPGIGRVADRAKRFARRERTLAVIARNGIAGGVDIILAAHLAAYRTSPANCHRALPPENMDDWTDARIADEKGERLKK